MKQALRRRLAILAFAFPAAALADLNGTTILQLNTALNLDTAKIQTAGGDILWNGASIIPQGNAKLRNIGALGAVNFDALGLSYFSPLTPSATAAAISGNSLVAGDVFMVVTNGGNIAKVLVTENLRTSIGLRFTAYGVSPASAGPVIAHILNNSSQIPEGFPNSGITPSSIFVVTGSGLADPGDPVLQSSEAPGIPTSLNGASLTVVVNGVTTHPALYYTSPTQLAAVLPSATPLGTGSLTVTYKGTTSLPAPIQVVSSALGINTYSVNTGVATDSATGALLTLASSGSPGETIVLWTTGLGANPDDSDTTYTLTPHRVNTPLQIYVGGVPAAILYQGASTYPGVNQINLTIPPSVPTGCWIPVVAIAGGVMSNAVTLPIKSGGGACIDWQTGLDGNQISPSGGQTLKAGLVSLLLTNSPGSGSTRTITSVADAAFEKYTGLFNPGKPLSPGGCTVGPVTPATVPTVTGLDAGAITLTGPSGLAVTLASQFGIKGAFFSMLPAGAIPSSGGTFTFKGSGGVDVGPFTSTITLSNPLLTWTNQGAAATIDRTRDLTFTWTGGNPGTYVFIAGSSGVAASGVTVGYTCLAPVEAGQYTVPSYILTALPAGSGGTNLQNAIYSPLSATGLDLGVAVGGIYYSVNSTYGSGSPGLLR